jgi:hypothetical protein
MIRTQAVLCASVLLCSKNDGQTAAETASDETVMGAMQPVCEFSLHDCQRNHLDLSLKALDDALKPIF